MNTSLINWTKDDKANLRRAITNFNNKISRLEKEGKKHLPDKVSYKELIGIKKLEEGEVSREILNRRELNNVIRSLQRFGRRGSEKEVTLPSGQKITAWGKNELRINKGRAVRNLKKELTGVNQTKGMGSERYEEIETTLRAIMDINNRKGYSFRKTMETLLFNARSDKELRKATIWAKNFRDGLIKIENYENSELLINKINSSEFKNPIKLWEFVSQSEILKDFWTFYNEAPDANTIAGFDNNQEAFNSALEQLGLL